jgi:hypothetical protein
MRDRTFLASLAIAFLLPAQAARSEDAGAAKKSAMKSYMYIKEDSDRFVGEGVAELKDFEGDASKASAAAKERALGDLASNVRVQVTSDNVEKTESKDGKVTEELKSASRSHADVALENVKTMEFKDFPDSGEVTVLASLDKEDYRRQLAGKAVRVYAPEWGVKLSLGRALSYSYKRLAENKPAASYLAANPNAALPDSSLNEWINTFGLDLDYGSWELGLQTLSSNLHFPAWDPGSNSYKDGGGGVDAAVHFGYNWTPWKTRLQPFVPLQVMLAFMQNNYVTGYGAGLGVRFWMTDSLALVLEGLGTGTLTKSPDIQLQPSVADNIDYQGVQASFGILWSGF